MNWVLLHGFVGSGSDFEPLARALGIPSRRLSAPDWPGHGERAHWRDPRDYTLESHLRLIDAVVAGLDGPVTLLGYSLGGRILQHWLRERSAALPTGSRIVLLSTGPGIVDPEERRRRRDGDAAVARLLRDEGMTRFLHYWHSQTMFQPLLRLPPDRLGPILHRRSACDAEGLALSLEGVGAGAVGDTWDVLRAPLPPTLLVAGARDGHYAELASGMAAAISGASLAVLEGAGHALHLEQPEALAAQLLRA